MQGAIPYVTDEHAADCNVLQAGFSTLGLPVLDGSRSECDWRPATRRSCPGTFPPDEVPALVRPDYVTNGNDSHWLSNPEEPLTGFARIIGIEEAERTLRTRLGLIQVEDRLAGHGRPARQPVQPQAAPAGRGGQPPVRRRAVARQRRLDVRERARAGSCSGSSGPVDVSGACEPLKAWDLHDNLDSNGAILFRRFTSQILNDFTTLPTGLQGGTAPGSETIFTTPFSVDDPVHTPSGLNTANPLVQRALADAVSDLEGAGIPLDAPLRGHQYEERGGQKIPIHGGPGSLGVFNAINVSWIPEKDGYGDVEHGSSFMMAAQFVDGKCPVEAGTFVTYSQSENQRSKHAADYTRAFSNKRWNRVPFCRGEVRRKALSTRRVTFGR